MRFLALLIAVGSMFFDYILELFCLMWVISNCTAATRIIGRAVLGVNVKGRLIHKGINTNKGMVSLTPKSQRIKQSLMIAVNCCVHIQKHMICRK